ncbi:FadR/GntR family transcriptional regulator [Pseudonocardia nigra]|uniref:FadR/GntR family transcriptional regulator n=1 Tax=Pseudonocardia nigra TaxID=1921578 RepID=UPI001C5FC2D6|nr:FadR/GntR family transcriptional regulator [Pseudonocardia nigra]
MTKSLIYLEAQARLRDFITEAGLGPGDRLPPEATLAAQLGVSRLSLREATRSLQTLGVIEARRGNGLFVSAFSFRPLIEQLPYGLAASGTALEEILTAREAMEVGLMPAVARRNPQPELAECARLADAMTALESRGESIAEVDKQFHLLLYRALGNPLVDNLIEVFWELFTRLGDAIPVPPEGGRGTVHLQIIRALQKRDAEASIAAMQQHFDDIRARAALLRPRESDAG